MQGAELRIKIGVGLANFPFEDARGYWRWFERCVRCAIDSIWQTDQLITRTPTLESISTMAALAGGTNRLKFGMNVTVVSHRDPLVLARQCATIDFLSGGRLLPAFGVGPGISPEWKGLHRDPKGRGRRADEALEIMSRLWNEPTVSFEGEFFHYTDVAISPRPVQDPLPLWIGGNSKAAIRRTARIGTGWVAGINSPKQVKPVVEAIAVESKAAGRPIPPDHFGAGLSYRFGSWDDPVVDGTAGALSRFQPDMNPREYLAVGGADAVLERIAEYRAAGISKFILRPMATSEQEVFEHMDIGLHGLAAHLTVPGDIGHVEDCGL